MTRGYIVPIGGAEEKVSGRAILRRFVELAGGPEARIAIIPTASRLPETGKQYAALFKDLGARGTRILAIEDRHDAKQERWVEALERATAVFMTGGNQLRLSTNIGGTPVADALREMNQRGVHIAGTSAGAAFVPEHMIAFGKEGPTPRADIVTLAPGLGLTDKIIVDQHFRQRGRLGRLLTALAYNPRAIGIGLDEDTAAFIGPNERIEVVGTGGITVVDPSEVEYSSMDSSKEHDAVCLIGVRLHVLNDGACYDLHTRKAMPAAAAT